MLNKNKNTKKTQLKIKTQVRGKNIKRNHECRPENQTCTTSKPKKVF